VPRLDSRAILLRGPRLHRLSGGFSRDLLRRRRGRFHRRPRATPARVDPRPSSATPAAAAVGTVRRVLGLGTRFGTIPGRALRLRGQKRSCRRARALRRPLPIADVGLHVNRWERGRFPRWSRKIRPRRHEPPEHRGFIGTIATGIQRRLHPGCRILRGSLLAGRRGLLQTLVGAAAAASSSPSASAAAPGLQFTRHLILTLRTIPSAA
jgi:hypothetical protein